MLRILLIGCNGAMGHIVQQVTTDTGYAVIVAGVDQNAKSQNAGFPIYTCIDEVREQAHVIIDFSHPRLLPSVLDYAKRTKIPAVLATTGYDDEAENLILEASKSVALFRSMNMSYGIHAMRKLVKLAAELLHSDYDMEILEAHHNKKADAPSGTAKMLLSTIREALAEEDLHVVYGREGMPGKRASNEIGIHSVRGGTIPGEHTVLFAGYDELIEIKHTALSKKVFAKGALKAARFLAGKADGLYTMNDI